jgi:hypothetical protein
MKRTFVAAATLTIVASGLLMAADMPTKALAPSVVSDWTGFFGRIFLAFDGIRQADDQCRARWHQLQVLTAAVMRRIA